MCSMWRCGTHTQGVVSTQGYLKAAGFKTPLTERPARLAQCVVTDLWPAVTRHPRCRDLQRCDFLLRILHFALKVGTMLCPCGVCVCSALCNLTPCLGRHQSPQLESTIDTPALRAFFEGIDVQATLERVASHRRLAQALHKVQELPPATPGHIDLPALAGLVGRYPVVALPSAAAPDTQPVTVAEDAGAHSPAVTTAMAAASELRWVLRRPGALKLVVEVVQRRLLPGVTVADVYAHYTEVVMFAPLPPSTALVHPPHMPAVPITACPAPGAGAGAGTPSMPAASPKSTASSSGGGSLPHARGGSFVAMPMDESKQRVQRVAPYLKHLSAQALLAVLKRMVFPAPPSLTNLFEDEDENNAAVECPSDGSRGGPDVGDFPLPHRLVFPPQLRVKLCRALVVKLKAATNVDPAPFTPGTPRQRNVLRISIRGDTAPTPGSPVRPSASPPRQPTTPTTPQPEDGPRAAAKRLARLRALGGVALRFMQAVVKLQATQPHGHWGSRLDATLGSRSSVEALLQCAVASGVSPSMVETVCGGRMVLGWLAPGGVAQTTQRIVAACVDRLLAAVDGDEDVCVVHGAGAGAPVPLLLPSDLHSVTPQAALNAIHAILLRIAASSAQPNDAGSGGGGGGDGGSPAALDALIVERLRAFVFQQPRDSNSNSSSGSGDDDADGMTHAQVQVLRLLQTAGLLGTSSAASSVLLSQLARQILSGPWPDEFASSVAAPLAQDTSPQAVASAVATVCDAVTSSSRDGEPEFVQLRALVALVAEFARHSVDGDATAGAGAGAGAGAASDDGDASGDSDGADGDSACASFEAVGALVVINATLRSFGRHDDIDTEYDDSTGGDDGVFGGALTHSKHTHSSRDAGSGLSTAWAAVCELLALHEGSGVSLLLAMRRCAERARCERGSHAATNSSAVLAVAGLALESEHRVLHTLLTGQRGAGVDESWTLPQLEPAMTARDARRRLAAVEFALLSRFTSMHEAATRLLCASFPRGYTCVGDEAAVTTSTDGVARFVRCVRCARVCV